MKIVDYAKTEAVIIIDSPSKKYKFVFSPFTSKEVDAEGNYVKKMLVEYITGKPSLEDLKNIVIKTIKEYDNSSYVNSFIYKNNYYWFDKNTRNSLVRTATLMKSLGKDTYDLYIGDELVQINCNSLLLFLDSLELYALNTFKITQSKLKNISTLNDITSIIEFNIPEGYPDFIELTL